MAQKFSLANSDAEIGTILTKALQSGHVNFLLGSGASAPAICVAGSIEKDLDTLLKESKPVEFEAKKHEFLCELQCCTNDLLDDVENENNATTLANYQNFLLNISHILEERKTDLLPKQVTVFTTNYDLFIEHASENMTNFRLNDGFLRNPAITSNYKFQPEHYFDAIFKTGTLFKYKFPIPTVNLIKLHGSLSWQSLEQELVYCVAYREAPSEGSDNYENKVFEFNSRFSLILPTRTKFHETLLTRVYYDLLRIFANTLEIENTVLLCFGFSFNDEHILDIVKRALKNPTLLVLIISYDESSVADYEKKFKPYNNVVVLHPEGAEKFSFTDLNALLASAIPSHET